MFKNMGLWWQSSDTERKEEEEERELLCKSMQKCTFKFPSIVGGFK